MSDNLSLELVPVESAAPVLATSTRLATASPFKRVIDPDIRDALTDALSQLIDDHQNQVTYLVESGQLTVDSYKEYVELFARFVRDTLGSRPGVKFLLDSCAIEGLTEEEINLDPVMRWKV